MDANNFNKALERFARKTIPQAIERVVDGNAEKLLERLRANSPVVTGRLRDSWSVRYIGEGLSRRAVISNSVPYATAVDSKHGIVETSIEEAKE
jgi:hypothetical protein